jgi:hypothetical protein
MGQFCKAQRANRMISVGLYGSTLTKTNGREEIPAFVSAVTGFPLSEIAL